MHQDIEKLLNAAKEKGSITEKQREIILNKAQQLGEDMAEVEFVLEDIPLLKKETDKRAKTKKCPQCGAAVSDLAIKCPDCGCVLHDESDATRRARDIIQEHSAKMNAINKVNIRKEMNDKGVKPMNKIDSFFNVGMVDSDIEKRTLETIASFSVPFTANAMIQGYEYAYARYLSVKDNVGDEEIANASLGKAKEMYGLIKSVQNPDEETLLWIKGHSSIMKEGSTLGRTASNVLGCGALILLSALGLGLYALITK